MHGEYTDTYPIEGTSEVDRGISDASWQKSACGNTISGREALYPDVMERLEKVEKEFSERRVWCDSVEARLQFLEQCNSERRVWCDSVEARLQFLEQCNSERRVWCDSVEARLQFLEQCNRHSTVSNLSKMQETSKLDPPYNPQQGSSREAFPGSVTQEEIEEKEYQKLKERIKLLEARNHELLSKLMSMHKQSENMNDPSRLSAVLRLYEMVRLRDWEKCRKSSTNMTYKNGRSIIQKLFDACEEYIEKRKNDIFNVLDISSSKYTYESQEFANCKQELMPIVTELLRNAYCQHYSDFAKIITEKANVTLENDDQKQFALQCCRVYCLMLLQESPVKAVWRTQEILPQHVEHVDKKAFAHWKKTWLLWPILKSGEEVIVKGVVWDLK